MGLGFRAVLGLSLSISLHLCVCARHSSYVESYVGRAFFWGGGRVFVFSLAARMIGSLSLFFLFVLFCFSHPLPPAPGSHIYIRGTWERGGGECALYDVTLSSFLQSKNEKLK